MGVFTTGLLILIANKILGKNNHYAGVWSPWIFCINPDLNSSPSNQDPIIDIPFSRYVKHNAIFSWWTMPMVLRKLHRKLEEIWVSNFLKKNTYKKNICFILTSNRCSLVCYQNVLIECWKLITFLKEWMKS